MNNIKLDLYSLDVEIIVELLERSNKGLTEKIRSQEGETGYEQIEVTEDEAYLIIKTLNGKRKSIYNDIALRIERQL